MEHFTSPMQEFEPVHEATLGQDTALTPNYHSYLLRLWRCGGSNWCGSLQSAQNGERHLFANLDSLFAFLLAQLGA